MYRLKRMNLWLLWGREIREFGMDINTLLFGGSDGKESACSAGDLGLIPGLGRSLEERMAAHSSILVWRIPVDKGAWRVTVHGVAESQMTL